MSTLKQIDANRRNALKSTGPTSATGKQRSSLNAYRHGLTAQVAVMPEEERAAFEAFSAPIIETLAPAQWRINRASAIEEGLFSLGNIDGIAEDLQQNGFVFTAAQVRAHIQRENQLERATKLANYNFDAKQVPSWLKKTA